MEVPLYLTWQTFPIMGNNLISMEKYEKISYYSLQVSYLDIVLVFVTKFCGMSLHNDMMKKYKPSPRYSVSCNNNKSASS